MRAFLTNPDINGDIQCWFFCPGCQHHHAVRVRRDGQPIGASWEWNQRLDLPTFKPSIRVQWTQGEERIAMQCHSFVTDGKIVFCDDCTHEMNGMTVDLPEVEPF